VERKEQLVKPKYGDGIEMELKGWVLRVFT
jgi:hypothetical protein